MRMEKIPHSPGRVGRLRTKCIHTSLINLCDIYEGSKHSISFYTKPVQQRINRQNKESAGVAEAPVLEETRSPNLLNLRFVEQVHTVEAHYDCLSRGQPLNLTTVNVQHNRNAVKSASIALFHAGVGPTSTPLIKGRTRPRLVSDHNEFRIVAFRTLLASLKSLFQHLTCRRT